ncbi:MAG: aldo/keto reductase [Hamadaea sp.]|nr:aldo/keto reductase [Hamadaea sp.]
MTGMRYRRLGASGLVVSAVGLGCNNFGRKLTAEETAAVVHEAVDAGITFIDAADVYGTPRGTCEMFVGEALKGRRDAVVLATKFGMNMAAGPGDPRSEDGARGSRRYIMTAVEDSLRRLQTDYIDLYQFHYPDAGTPIEETLRALDDLVRQGKVRYIGSSQFAGWQVTDAAWTAQVKGLTSFISTQQEYSWLSRRAEADLIPACLHAGVGFIPFYPLRSGLLTGVYRRGQAAPPGTRLATGGNGVWLENADWDTIEALESFAAEAGVSLLDVAIGGLAAKPGVATVIAGATSPRQVRANARAGAWSPTADELARLDEITRPSLTR